MPIIVFVTERENSSNNLLHMRLTTKHLALRLTFALLLLTLAFRQDSQAWSGRVVALEDGDSGKALSGLTTIEFRLYGIDAPEFGQPYCMQAKRTAAGLLQGKQIEFKTTDRDQYGREVGLAYVNGRCINEELIGRGCAWVYPAYCKERFCADWAALEALARSKKVGLWRDSNPLPPWQYRQTNGRPYLNRRAAIPTQAAVAVEFHGNTLSKVFHGPKCEHYNCKNCTMRFYTKAQAMQAGFKPCAVCKP